MSDCSDHMIDAYESLDWDDGPSQGEDTTFNQIGKKKTWTIDSIKNKEIRKVVNKIIKNTWEYEPWIYHVSLYNSVYIKFKNPKMCSIRVADHKQRNSYKYKWNVLVCSDTIYESDSMYDGNVLRHFYPSNKIYRLFENLREHYAYLNMKVMNFGKLRVKLKEEKPQPGIFSTDEFPKLKNKTEDETGEQGMKTKNIAAVMMDDCKTIGYVFPGGSRVYTYKTTEEFEIDDCAVVNDRNGDFAIIRVVEVHKVPQIDVDSSIQHKWIVQKIDTTNHDELNERESKFNDHLLEVQQKSVKQNAINMLAEKLGTGLEELKGAVKLLNGDK